MEPQITEPQSVIAPLKKVTPLSKYLAMTLFIILPFLGGWIGYTYAPEKVVEVEKVIISEINHDDVIDSRSEYSQGKKNISELTIYDYSGSYFNSVPHKYKVESDAVNFILELDNADGSLSVNGSALENSFDENGLFYHLDGPGMFSDGYRLTIKDGINPNSFEKLSSYYIKDATAVYYVSFPDGSRIEKLDLNPITATTTIAGLFDIHSRYITDGIKLYYQDSLLEGVDPKSMIFEKVPGVISEGEVIYLNKGGCMGAMYIPGTLEDLKTYVAPC